MRCPLSGVKRTFIGHSARPRRGAARLVAPKRRVAGAKPRKRTVGVCGTDMRRHCTVRQGSIAPFAVVFESGQSPHWNNRGCKVFSVVATQTAKASDCAANGFALSPPCCFSDSIWRMSNLVSEAATFTFVPRGLPVGPEGHPVPTQ